MLGSVARGHQVQTANILLLRRLKSFLSRRLTDAVLAATALGVALELRMSGRFSTEMRDGLPLAMLVTALMAIASFSVLRVYRRPWRYFSASDLPVVGPAALLTAVGTWLVLQLTGNGEWLPHSVPVIQLFILLVLVAGVRFARRFAWDRRRPTVSGIATSTSGSYKPQPVLLVGEINQIELVLRSLECSFRDRYRPIGIIDREGGNASMRVRGVAVLGTLDALDGIVNQMVAEGDRPTALLIVDGPDRLSGPDMVRLVSRAEVLGLGVCRVAQAVGVDTRAGELDFRFVDMAALLGRPQAQHDPSIARPAIAGRRVMVTGAGGTIGSELARQIAALGPSELILLDHSELNLYTIDMEMAENFPAVSRHAVLCSIRQRAALFDAFERHLPELVFHAAALKHVPLVELNPAAGVMTNVLGTRNVADAALRFGVKAMVQVSTDKAVNPVGVMGATKRLGELYCQALDLAGIGDDDTPRFVTVRFGNVLGSSGSLIPLFQRQLARRGPLTVTHSEITRYFMTVNEAVHLILQSSAEAVRRGVGRGRIFVLDMGDPIKIIDIARRMIRLAGLEPDVDVKIEVVGLRPGEKLYEELFDTRERQLKSALSGVKEAEPVPVSLGELDLLFDRLERASMSGEPELVRRLVLEATGQAAPAEEPAAEDIYVRPRRTVKPTPLASAAPAQTRGVL